MNFKIYAIVTSVLFAVIGLVHVLRLVWDWEVLIGGWSMPLWVSVAAILVLGYLAFEGGRHAFGPRRQLQ